MHFYRKVHILIIAAKQPTIFEEEYFLMYLRELNEKQKNCFLDLAISLAAADGDFSDMEKNAIHLLCDEMCIADRYQANASPDDAIRLFASESNQHIQRIVVIELLGVAMADNVFEERELELVDKAAKAFLVGKDELEEISNAIAQLYGLYVKFNHFIGL